MQPINDRIMALEKEIADLLARHNEAKEEYSYFDEEAAYFRKKAEEAEKRMQYHWDEIEYRMAKITELEDELNGQVSGASTAESA